MANYDSSNTGGQIDGSVASSSLYFSGIGGSDSHISASSTISGSNVYVNSNLYGNFISSSGGFYSTGESNLTGNITGSNMHVSMSDGTISASAIYATDGHFGPTSLFIGGEHITADKWNRVEKGRKPQALSVNAFSNGDTTPSIDGSSVFKTKTSAVGSTTITDFDDGDAGDEITVICSNSNTRINDGSGIETPSGAQLRCVANDVYKFVYDGTTWFTVSVSDNS